MQQVHVRKDQLHEAELVELQPGLLADGAVRLAIESFSVTANNVTYAVVGDGFGYWNFFPAPAGEGGGTGIVPMWGHARIVESNHAEIAVGERVYGYLPMATHLDVQPAKVSASSFIDGAEHRQPMSPIYNQYSRLAADPEHDPAHEGERMIFGPLFKTGFLIEYFMRSEGWFEAEQLVLTSASSKTALGLAAVAKQRSPDMLRVGLTSAGNVKFVEESGLYDTVLAYSALDMLDCVPSVTVDFAGNAELLASLHRHFRDQLRYSCLVGVTHVGARGALERGDEALPGPEPTLFFAPDHAVALFKEVGPEAAGMQMAESWRYFLGTMAHTITIDRRAGLEAARGAFLAILGGDVDPSAGIVIEP